jgi:hypothetical protein
MYIRPHAPATCRVQEEEAERRGDGAPTCSGCDEVKPVEPSTDARVPPGEICAFVNTDPDPTLNNGFGAPLFLGEATEDNQASISRSP